MHRLSGSHLKTVVMRENMASSKAHFRLNGTGVHGLAKSNRVNIVLEWIGSEAKIVNRVVDFMIFHE